MQIREETAICFISIRKISVEIDRIGGILVR